MDDEITEPKLTKRQLREISGYWKVIWMCALIYLTPLAIMVALLPAKSPRQTPGILRVEPGQAVILDTKSAASPNNTAVLAAESLNASLANIVLGNPGQAPIIKTSDSAGVARILIGDPDMGVARKTAKDIETVRQSGGRWAPEAGPWGLFLLPSDPQPPKTQKTFGLAEIPTGAELARINCERTLNRKAFDLAQTRGPAPEPNDIWGLMELACSEGLITPDEARQAFAAAQTLKIMFIPEKNLYLSRETGLQWNKVTKTLQTLPKQTEGDNAQ